MKKLQWGMMPEHGLDITETAAKGDAIGVVHLARYWWAWGVAAALGSSRIADLGCGCGYGCRIVAEQQRPVQVLGIDADLNSLNLARKDYGRQSSFGFVHMSLDAPWFKPVQDQDLIVSFELLEYLRNREIFLEQVVNALKDDGVFLLSAGLHRANIEVWPDLKDAHIRYNKPLLLNTLSRYFNHVAPYEPLRNGSGRSDVFDFIHQTNRDLKAQFPPGKAPEVGHDLVYCASPIRKQRCSYVRVNPGAPPQ